MHFDETDPDFSLRVKRHTEFHSKARVQGRNTTQGVPEFV
jgi:hypothetical protein